jgi:hypothetical protein
MLNNRCHSLSRNQCYKLEDKFFGDVYDYEHETIEANKFYNAVDCAKEVLNSSYLKFSVIAMAILTILLI